MTCIYIFGSGSIFIYFSLPKDPEGKQSFLNGIFITHLHIFIFCQMTV